MSAAPRRALITGITGQDGSYLTELLVERGYEVVGMVRTLDPAPVPAGASTVPGDLLDAGSLRAAVHTVRPDELYHLAAPTFVPASWEQPGEVLAAIAGATATLLEAVHALDPPPRTWVATSSEIFGNAGESPQRETSPMRPQTPYGVAKLAAHGLVGTLRARHGSFLCSGILFNHESPRRPEQFLPRKVSRAVAAIRLGRQDELVLGDLDAVRDWSHAADVARAAWLALQHDAPGDYVIASGVGRTVRELVDASFAHAGLDAERYVRVDPTLVRAPESTPAVGDPARAHAVLGWQPRYSFAELVAEMVDADLAALSR